MNLQIILFFLFLTSCGQGGGKVSINSYGGKRSPKVINSKPTSNGPILLIGDDYALGTGATSTEFTLIGCLNKITNKITLSSSKTGETTHSALETVENVLNLNPSAVIVSLGVFDIFESEKSTNIPAAETLKNIDNIYSILLKSKALVIQLGIVPPWKDRRLTKIKYLAQQKGVLYIDSGMTPLWNNPWYMEDFYHPNNLGYSIICKNLIRSMKPHYNF